MSGKPEMAAPMVQLETPDEMRGRVSAVNNVFCLRTGWLTTPTMTRSKILAVRLMMSMCPFVTGS